MRKKDWKKRVASAVLAAAMVVSQIGVWNAGVGLEVVKAEETNLITNGGFENEGIEPWTVEGENVTASAVTWAAKTGSKGLELNYPWEDGRTSQTTKLTQAITTLPAGEYEFSISIAGTTDASDAFAFIRDGGTDTTPNVNQSTNWNDYKTYSTRISVGEDQANYVIGIELNLKASTDKKIIIDDVSLTKVVEEETTGPIIKNGDFENGINDWTTEGLTDNVNYCIKKSDGHDSNDLEIWKPSSDLTFSISQEITIPAGTYTLSIDSAGNADLADVKIGNIITLKPDWSKFDGTQEAVTKTSEKFVVSEDTTATVSISGTLTSGWDGMYFDNIVLNKIEVADKSKLQALVNKAPTNLNDFESNSATALSGKLENAKNCLENDGATSDEVNTCYNELETALNALVYEDSTINVSKIDGLNDKTDFIKGVDISSYVTEVNSGVKYYDWNGDEITSGKDFVKLFAETGVNYIRIRVWNDPKNAEGDYYGGGNNDLEMAKTICGYIKDYNDAYKNTLGEVKVLVDLQYSDFWADPEKQAAPKAWAELSIEDKVQKVTEFTNYCLTEIAATGVTIGMVQIGNETNTGICGTKVPSIEEKDFEAEKETLKNSDYIKIFAAGCDAVDQYNTDHGTTVKKVVHFTDPHTAGTFYAKMLKTGGVNYDVYATSYYPFWHGTTDNLKTMLSAIANACKVEVMVAETQYVYTNDDYDGADNQAYEGKNNIDLSKWPVSVQGQANEIRDVMYAAANAKNGIGMFYWEPAWLGVGNAYNDDGTLNETKLSENKTKWETYGSGWATDAAKEYDPSAAEWGGGGTNNENASLFDFTGHPLASLNVFKFVNYGARATSSSYYSYNKDEMKNITVAVGATPESITSVLEENNPTIGYINNDNTKGTAGIVWNTDSVVNIANQIKTTKAVGNAFLAKGTITVDGQSYEVTCSVFVKPDKNYIENGDFESTNGWNYENGDMIFIEANNARNNSTRAMAFKSGETFVKNLTPDNNGCYTGMAYQEVKLEAGIYEARAFFEGGSGTGGNKGEKIGIYVQSGENTVFSNGIILKGWMDWQSASIPNIVVTDDMVKTGNNSITFGISVCIQPDDFYGWGSVDDCYLYKVGEYTAPSGGSGSVTTPSTDDTTTTPDDTTVITNPDGTTTETKTETVTNEAGKEVAVTTETQKDAEGNVTGITETSVIENIVGKADATITVDKNAAGEITSAQAVVDKSGAKTTTGVKATLYGSVISQVIEAAGTESVEIVMTVTAGKKEYTIKADAEDITAGNKLKVMAIDPKTGKYVLVNAKTYTVSEAGNVKVTLPEGATYQLLDSKDAAAVEKEILATVKVKKTSATVETGKKTTVQMSSKLDMDNVESITYSTSKKSVATVSKNGKVTAKKAGTVTIKVIVTLKNGQTKTIKMKVKVK